jgi:hypothetical protein
MDKESAANPLLKEATTDEIVDELTRRYSTGLIVAINKLPEKKASTAVDWSLYCRGKVETTLKLANIALWEHQKEIIGDSEPISMEDEDGN